MFSVNSSVPLVKTTLWLQGATTRWRQNWEKRCQPREPVQRSQVGFFHLRMKENKHTAIPQGRPVPQESPEEPQLWERCLTWAGRSHASHDSFPVFSNGQNDPEQLLLNLALIWGVLLFYGLLPTLRVTHDFISAGWDPVVRGGRWGHAAEGFSSSVWMTEAKAVATEVSPVPAPMPGHTLRTMKRAPDGLARGRKGFDVLPRTLGISSSEHVRTGRPGPLDTSFVFSLVKIEEVRMNLDWRWQFDRTGPRGDEGTNREVREFSGWRSKPK